MADKTDTTSTAGESAIGKETNAKVVVKNVDMSEDMQGFSIETAIAALEQFNMEKDIAAFVKKKFDNHYGATWHAVVGKNFGSFVTHGEYDTGSNHLQEDWCIRFLLHVGFSSSIALSLGLRL